MPPENPPQPNRGSTPAMDPAAAGVRDDRTARAADAAGLAPAPLYPAPALPAVAAGIPAPAMACAFWTRADDGVRLRVALWRDRQAHATVLLFPGRTEYAEKYHPVAAWLVAQGHAVLTIDWRGQGASDRLLANPRAGHVDDFAAYQQDVAAMVAAARRLDLPRPWHLLCHSMGGAIGLRALHCGLPVQRAVFSAPMWGIRIGSMPDRPGPPLVRVLVGAAVRVGLGRWQLPGEGLPPADPQRRRATFARNPLTSDPDWWDWLGRLNAALPDHMIGPPTLAWLRAALAECRALAGLPAPAIAALISLPGDESIVSASAIRARAARWPLARLLALPGARHEALFERTPIRQQLLDAIAAQFAGAPGADDGG